MFRSFSIVFFASILLFSGCRDKKDFIGPEYAVASSNFKISAFTSGLSSVNFENKEHQYFVANFTDRVSWKIILQGQESNAIKIIEGLSDEINKSNSSWNGVHDGTRFFNNEKVLATLSFIGTDQTTSSEFSISAPIKYPEAVKLGNGFEGAAWQGPWFDPGEDNGSGKTNQLSIQGKSGYRLKGTDLSGNYYMGVIRKAYNSELPENAEEVYFNIYAYGVGDATSVLKLAGKEDENGNRTFDDASEDAWEKEILLGHHGWKLFSFKYADFNRAADKNFGGNGNNKREPHKIVAVDIALQTTTPKSSAEAIFDFPIITVGKPFQPDIF